jgi:DNA-binding response OmpR family regulator
VFQLHAADVTAARRRILVADDEPNIVTALEFLLEKGGYEVQVARNGDEALRMMEDGPPDLVVLDVMMPQRSGYEVSRSIRDRPEWAHVKIVMLSAKGRAVEIGKGIAAGADLYITKPFSTSELVQRIDGLLAG